MPDSDFRFPKSTRLLKRRDFRRVQRNHRSGNSETLRIEFRDTPKFPGRVGLTVSKKVGNAVVRNRVKRRLREILRHHKFLFQNRDLVVIVRPPAASAPSAKLREDLLSAVQAAAKKTPRPSPARRSNRREKS